MWRPQNNSLCRHPYLVHGGIETAFFQCTFTFTACKLSEEFTDKTKFHNFCVSIFYEVGVYLTSNIAVRKQNVSVLIYIYNQLPLMQWMASL